MKIRRISRRPLPLESAGRSATPRPRAEFIRAFIAVTLAVALIGTGAIALPSLSPLEAGIEIPPRKGPQLEPDVLADIESVHSAASKLAGPLAETVADVTRALPSTAARVARATTAVTRPIAEGIDGDSCWFAMSAMRSTALLTNGAPTTRMRIC
jgi:hypothetical protein